MNKTFEIAKQENREEQIERTQMIRSLVTLIAVSLATVILVIPFVS